MTQLIPAISLWEGYLSLTRKDSITHVHGLDVYVKKGLPFVPDLSLEKSADSYLCFWLTLLHSLPYFFFLCPSPYSPLSAVFRANSSDIDKALLIRPSVNIFVFRGFNVHRRNWLSPSNGNDIIFLSQMPLLRWLTFLLGFLDCDCQSPAALVMYIFIVTLVFVPQWLSLHWEILIIFLFQFPLTFIQTQKGMPIIIAQLMTILVLIVTTLWSLKRCSVVF